MEIAQTKKKLVQMNFCMLGGFCRTLLLVKSRKVTARKACFSRTPKPRLLLGLSKSDLRLRVGVPRHQLSVLRPSLEIDTNSGRLLIVTALTLQSGILEKNKDFPICRTPQPSSPTDAWSISSWPRRTTNHGSSQGQQKMSHVPSKMIVYVCNISVDGSSLQNAINALENKPLKLPREAKSIALNGVLCEAFSEQKKPRVDSCPTSRFYLLWPTALSCLAYSLLLRWPSSRELLEGSRTECFFANLASGQ